MALNRGIGPEPDRSDSASRRGYRVAIAAGLVFIAIRLLVPDFIDNEPVYALGPVRLLHPDFLPSAQFFGRVNPYFFVFDALTSPFYLVADWLIVTVVLRAAIWLFQLWALARLCQTLGLRWWGFALVLLTWLNVSQHLGAGEWIIGSTSGKPVAYGFIFLALEAALRDRWNRAAVFGGLAASFHVLVGGWALAALGVAFLVHGDRTWSVARGALIRAVGFSLPGLAPAVISILTAAPPGEDPKVATRIYVEIATPFHLDPGYFLTGLEPVRVGFYFLATLLLIAWLFPRPVSRKLIVFLGVLLGVFLSGLVAHRIGLLGFLKYYPFRVADGMFPLFFWIGVAAAAQRAVAPLGRWGPAVALAASTVAVAGARTFNAVLRDSETPAPDFLDTLLRGEPRASGYWARTTGQAWTKYLSGVEDDFAKMERWIRANTPDDAVFVIPPWRYSFPLRAHRSEFMTFKSPALEAMTDWLARWEALNGGPLKTRGAGIVNELRESYPRLTAENLERIRSRWRADYFVTDGASPGGYPLLHREGTWSLYRLAAAQ